MRHRLDRLDHLRAVAAFLVIAWHFTGKWSYSIAPNFEFLSIFKEGWTGVSLFCVISGFILTTIYYERDGDYVSFIRNRLFRILPLFLFVLYLSFYASEWDAGSLVLSVLTGLVRGGLQSYAGPGWTVLVELQFYLIFPFLLIFTRNWGAKYLFGLLLMFVLVRASVWFASSTVQQVAYYSIFGRMDQFLAGMFAARLISAPSFRVVLTRNYLNVLLFVSAGVSLIAFFWWFSANGGLLTFNGEVWPNKSAVFIFLPTIEAVAYAALLLSYLHLPAIPKLSLISKGFSYVGLVSYSIYLDHLLLFPFIFWFIEYLGIVPASWEQSLLLCLLIPIPMLTAAASVTFFMIEKPFMSLRRSKSVASPAHVSPARSEPARLVEVPRVAGTAP